MEIAKKNAPNTISAYKKDSKDNTQFTLQFGVELFNKYIKAYPRGSELYEPLIGPDGKPYCEMGFALKLDIGLPGMEIVLVGKIDMIVKRVGSNEIFIVDHKTTNKTLNDDFFSKFNPNNQMSMYIWAARELLGITPVGAIINGIRVYDYKKLSKEKQQERLFVRSVTIRTKSQIDERTEQLRHLCRELASKVESKDVSRFEQRTSGCYAFGTRQHACQYRALCVAHTPKLVEMFIDSGAYREERWFPYEELRDALYHPDGKPYIVEKEVKI